MTRDTFTRILHADRLGGVEHGAVLKPLHIATAYGYSTAEELTAVFQGDKSGHIYGRQGNPTTQGLETRISLMEDAVGTVCFATGMAAICSSMMALLKKGDHVVASRFLFGNTASWMNTLTHMGCEVSLVDATEAANVEGALRAQTRLVFVETVANPRTQVADLAGIGKLCAARGLVYVVDSTMSTPCLFQPRSVGASLVVHSLSKSICGHGNALGGSISDTGLYDWNAYPHILPAYRKGPATGWGLLQIRKKGLRDMGATLSAEHGHRIAAGAETLPLRMARACANARVLAEWLQTQPLVAKVHYPGLASHPQHARAKALFKDFGALLAFETVEGIDPFQVLNALELVIKSSHLGDNRTSALPVARTIFWEMGAEQRESMEIADSLIRVSVGIEAQADLLADFEQAFNRIATRAQAGLTRNSVIVLRNLILRRSAKVLLDNVSVTINPGEKVGLVGRNGAGKSTLFGLFNGTLHEDGGDFSMPSQWRLGQVAQNMPETDESATDFVLGGDTRLIELRQALARAEAKHELQPDDQDIGMEIAHLHSDLADAGEHDAVPRAQSLILGLGFTTAQLYEPVNSFSGGWRMRLQLARALMCPSDLLLLDEPTNHLDLDALVWLEAWLKRYAGTMIVISHDREFLDAVTNVTLHIERQQLIRYGGNYSAFELLRAQQLELQQSAFSKQKEKIAHLQKFIDRFKAKASKAKQAQSRVKALERMEKIAPVLADAEFTFEFKEPANLPNPMLAISAGEFGYVVDGEPKLIVGGVSRSVMAGQRIGILGANGQGKSTLVKTIARDIPALGGTITEGKGLNIGYFAQQELDVLRPQDTPLEHMFRLARELRPNSGEFGREQDLRNFLGTFNFTGDMVKQAVGTMSGGEKARLVLAMMVWQRPNLLLLDEPTNHLDLATREALSMALNEFEGTVMLVSHDRALLRAVCDEFWLVGRGKVAPFDGDLDDYQKYLLDESKRLRELARQESTGGTPQAPAPAPAATPAPALPSLTPQEQRKQDAQQRQQASSRAKPLKRELEQAEKRLAQLNADKAALEARLATPLPAVEIAQAGKRLKAVNDELHSLEERWLELTEQIDNMA